MGGERGKGAIKLIIQELYDKITPLKTYDIIKLAKKTLHQFYGTGSAEPYSMTF